jgi:hypothetical protein
MELIVGRILCPIRATKMAKRKKYKRFSSEQHYKSMRRRYAWFEPDFKKLYETLSAREFTNYVLLHPYLSRRAASHWKTSYEKKLIDFYKVHDYYHMEDLYKYFEINHELNKDKEVQEYRTALIHLILDLAEQIPKEDFISLEEDLEAGPAYVYGHTTELPFISNIAHDFFYGIDINQLYRMDHYLDILKRIYQKGLMPLDISEKSYIF